MCKGFTNKLVVSDSKASKDLHTNKYFKIEKVQRIYIETRHLKLKKCIGFTYKLVVLDSKRGNDLHRN